MALVDITFQSMDLQDYQVVDQLKMASNHMLIDLSSSVHMKRHRVINYERLVNKTINVAVFLTNVVNASRPHPQLWSSPSMARVQKAAGFFDQLRLRYIGIFQRPDLLPAINELTFDFQVRKLLSGEIQNRVDIRSCYADIFCNQGEPGMAMSGLEHIADVFGQLMQEVSVLCDVHTINLL